MVSPCLYFRYTFAIFKADGKSRRRNDLLIIFCRGPISSAFHIFKSFVEILSYPVDDFVFRDCMSFDQILV